VAGVSREQIGSAGHVAGVDLCSEIFAVARAVALDSDWREGDVSALPLRDGELSRRCRLPTDKPVAAAEMRRAVVKGGRSAVATSRSDDEITLMRELRRVAERRLPRSVGQDGRRERERARCGTLWRWLAERDRLQGADPRAYDRLWRNLRVRPQTAFWRVALVRLAPRSEGVRSLLGRLLCSEDRKFGRCQGNVGFADEVKRRLSSGDLRHKGAPLGQGSRASQLVDLSRDEMAFLIELVVDLGVN
jgi:hypothetical protein